jgi:hypothetical protein
LPDGQEKLTWDHFTKSLSSPKGPASDRRAFSFADDDRLGDQRDQ